MSDTSTSDDSLDLTSSTFDPLKALYSPKVKLPYRNAPIQDNITKFVSVEGEITIKGKAIKKEVKDELENAPSTSFRRFEPHQEPVSRKHKPVRNVLTRMEATQGPLALLKDFMERRIRLKITTRNMIAIRGFCIGYVIAFDKHWNMALEDVTEVWTRKKRRKTPVLGAPVDLTRLRVHVPVPPVVVRKTLKKTEECERHVNQLLVRGEHIVMICALQP